MKTVLALSALAAAATAQEGRIYFMAALVIEDSSVDDEFTTDQANLDDAVPHINTFGKEGDFSDVGAVTGAAFGSDTAACQANAYDCTVGGTDDGELECEASDDGGSFQWECQDNMIVRVNYADDASCGGDGLAGLNGVATVKYEDCVFTASQEDLESGDFCGFYVPAVAFASMPHSTAAEDLLAEDGTYHGYYYGVVDGNGNFISPIGPCWYTEETGAYSKDIAQKVMFGFSGDYTSERSYQGAACNDDAGVTGGRWTASYGCVPVGVAVAGPVGFLGYEAVQTAAPSMDYAGNSWMLEKDAYRMSYKNGSLWCNAYYTDAECENMVTETPGLGSGGVYGYQNGVHNINCENIFQDEFSLNKCVVTGHATDTPEADVFTWTKKSASGASMVAPALALVAPIVAAFL